MVQTIPNGGDRDSQDLYIGPRNEITIDESNNEVRVHDGSKPGGWRIPNIDTNDSKYQEKNPDLEALNFPANLRGWLVRRAAGIFALRKLTGGNGVEIDNADGYAGNPIIRIGAEIPNDLTFKSDVLIEKVLQVDGGVNANVAGNLEGDSTGAHFGSIDTTTGTVKFKDDQIPQKAVDGLIAALATATMPVGTVLMWAGALDAIPNGWAFCDGTQGTPDLRGRFVGGASADNMHETGGSNTHTHVGSIQSGGSHSHAASAEGTQLQVIHLPEHQHGNGEGVSVSYLNPYGTIPIQPQTSWTAQIEQRAPGSMQGLTAKTGGNQPHGHSVSMQNSGEHTHGITIDQSLNLPPYHCLAFIMRIS